jgi:CTP:molybdopterin cytidylyltransferase MocA
MKVRGDVGARDVVRKNLECVLAVEIENDVCLIDMDCEEDLRQALALLRK